MFSRRLLFLTGLVGLTFATVAGIESVSAVGLGGRERPGIDGPEDPALEKLVQRHRARAIDHQALPR